MANNKPIAASELVARFQAAIDKYGDYDVVVQLPNGKLSDDLDFSFWAVTLDPKSAQYLKHKLDFVGSQTKVFKIKCS